jgi:F0F1-type ATP synthase membrane subunit b/b'
MKILTFTILMLTQLAKQIWSLPKTISQAIQDRRQRIVADDQEAERLDRIRNPSKYIGK